MSDGPASADIMDSAAFHVSYSITPPSLPTRLLCPSPIVLVFYDGGIDTFFAIGRALWRRAIILSCVCFPKAARTRKQCCRIHGATILRSSRVTTGRTADSSISHLWATGLWPSNRRRQEARNKTEEWRARWYLGRGKNDRLDLTPLEP